MCGWRGVGIDPVRAGVNWRDLGVTPDDLSRTRNDLGPASSLPLPCVHFDENADENGRSRDHFSTRRTTPKTSKTRTGLTTTKFLVRPGPLDHSVRIN